MTNEKGLLAGKKFAEMGAEVIKLELVSGSNAINIELKYSVNGISCFWESYAGNKKGITSNLQTTEGRDLFLKLCSKVDFLNESEPVGTLKRLRLLYVDLKEINTKLIYVLITPFGSEGPKANYADSDIILWAAGTVLF